MRRCGRVICNVEAKALGARGDGNKCLILFIGVVRGSIIMSESPLTAPFTRSIQSQGYYIHFFLLNT
jgi:hypothetical protein